MTKTVANAQACVGRHEAELRIGIRTRACEPLIEMGEARKAEETRVSRHDTLRLRLGIVAVAAAGANRGRASSGVGVHRPAACPG